MAAPLKFAVNRPKLQDLVAQLDPMQTIDKEVQDLLLEIADDFIESVTRFGCALAKHRGSTTLEVQDLQLHLERTWDIAIPEHGSLEVRPSQRPTASTIHKQRLAAVRRAKENPNQRV